MPTKRILLLGSGFSRNWGGWLAGEFTEYLLGQRELNQHCRGLLIEHRALGFEGALEALQKFGANEPMRTSFERALKNAFDQMNAAFRATPDWNFSNDVEFLVSGFLTRFDAIFTLNQDALLETQYLFNSPELLSDGRINGCVLPGMKRTSLLDPFDRAGSWVPDGTEPTLQPKMQPYIKLHGSTNWRSATGDLLVMGGNKTSAIAQEPILRWGMKAFDDLLAQPDTRLMIIGYGFRDDHINASLVKASKAGNLTSFIIDPNGIDAVNWRAWNAPVPYTSELASALWPAVRGASRRPLSSTFSGKDRAEHAKLKYFLE